MLLHRVAGHQNVVQVDEDAVQPVQHLVHEALEGLPGIPEAKGHPQKLEEAEGGDHRRLGDVLGGHWHLVVPLPQIQLGEDLLAGQLGREILHVGRRVHVPLCGQVQPPVVAAGPPGAVRLLHHVQR